MNRSPLFFISRLMTLFCVLVFASANFQMSGADAEKTSPANFKTEMDKAYEEWMSSNDDIGRRRKCVELFSKWTAFDPTGALKWIESDPGSSLKWTESLPDGRKSVYLQCHIVEHWAAKDLDAAEKWVRSAGKDNPDLLNNLITGWIFYKDVDNDGWTEKDFLTLIGIASMLPDGDNKDDAFSVIFIEWSKRDPVFALKRAESLPERKDKLTVDVFKGWAMIEPDKATDRAMALPDGKMKDDALAAVFNIWGGRDPFAAMKKAESLPERKDALTAGAIEGWAGRAPDAAVEWLSRSQGGSGNMQTAAEWALKHPGNDIMWNVIQIWISKTPDDAVRWVQSLPKGNARDEALGHVIKELDYEVQASMIVDFDGSRKWAEGLPEGECREYVMKAIEKKRVEKERHD